MKGNLETGVNRGEKNRGLMLQWLPIIYNIFLTIEVGILAVIPLPKYCEPVSGWLRIAGMLIIAFALYRICFYSSWGKTKIWNFVWKFMKDFDETSF
jgi:hypothetical protein